MDKITYTYVYMYLSEQLKNEGLSGGLGNKGTEEKYRKNKGLRTRFEGTREKVTVQC